MLTRVGFVLHLLLGRLRLFAFDALGLQLARDSLLHTSSSSNIPCFSNHHRVCDTSPGYIRLYSRSVALLATTKDVLLGVLGVIVIVIAQDFFDKVKEVIEAAKEILDDVKEVVEAAKEVASTSENEQWNQEEVCDYAEKNE
ncbi:hypothetical protein N7527_010037 [Penicillium freii]|nr:hypothetical protein N7527_010037 [Penicillium freii]